MPSPKVSQNSPMDFPDALRHVINGKKITKLDGSQENLPDVGEMNDPSVQARYPDIPEYMGANPEYMGLGIKRESPNHY